MFLKGPFCSVQLCVHEKAHPGGPKFRVYGGGVGQVKAVLAWVVSAIVEWIPPWFLNRQDVVLPGLLISEHEGHDFVA